MVRAFSWLGAAALGCALSAAVHGQEAPTRPMLGFETPVSQAGADEDAQDDKTKKGDEPTTTITRADELAAARPITALFSLRHDIGDGVGFRNGFTYLEGFIPVSQRPGQSLSFANVRVVNFDDKNLWEWNIGGGHRWLNRRGTFVLGVNAYYDGNRTYHNDYHQLGVGFEALGQLMEFRLNTYTVMGRRETHLGTTFTDPFFIARNIGLNRSDFVETALSGFDCEAGGPLPYLRRFDPRGFVGFYHYSGSSTQSANGFRFRAEARVSDRVTAHAVVQNDGRFDTTAYGGLAIHFGQPRPRFRGLIEDKLGNRVVRDVNIVLDQDDRKSKELAIDPNTGKPIEVTHIASFAPAGGDGTFERPFGTLTAGTAGSKPNQIVFVHAGSVFTVESMYLQNGQRFLGEGIPHNFTSTQGTFLLPRATTNTALPMILNTFDCAVHLASNTEVSGFFIDGSSCNGVIGENIQNVFIHRNTITNTSAGGVFLGDVTGNVTVANNVIDSQGLEAIFFGISQGSANLTITGNRLSQSGTDQVGILAIGNSVLTANIQGNVFDKGFSGDDIFVAAAQDARVNIRIEGNVMNSPGNNGISLVTFTDAHMRAIVKGNRIDNAASDGIYVETNEDSTMEVQIARNTITNSGLSSVYAEVFDSSKLGMQIFGNTVNNDVDLVFNAGAIFNLEGTSPLAPFLMGTNTFLGGAVANVDPGVTPVAFGFFGFPAP